MTYNGLISSTDDSDGKNTPKPRHNNVFGAAANCSPSALLALQIYSIRLIPGTAAERWPAAGFNKLTAIIPKPKLVASVLEAVTKLLGVTFAHSPETSVCPFALWT